MVHNIYYVCNWHDSFCTSRLFCPWAGRLLWQLHDILLLPCRQVHDTPSFPVSHVCLATYQWCLKCTHWTDYSDFLTFFSPESYILFLASEFLSLCNHWRAMNVVLQKTVAFTWLFHPLQSTQVLCMRVCVFTCTHTVYECVNSLLEWHLFAGRIFFRVGHDWATSLSRFTFMHWRGKWQPTPVFLPGESQGRGSLVGCRLWDRTELDTTEAT